MLYTVVAIEFTGIALVALYLSVDTDFYAEALFKTIHELGERLVFEIVDTVFPQFRLERADDRLLEFAVFELSAVARFEGRALVARRDFYRAFDERYHEVFLFGG